MVRSRHAAREGWLALVAIVCALAGWPVAAAGATFGSSLRARPNLGFGCESALIRDAITGGPVLTPSNQTTCTYRNLGFLNRLGSGSLVPATGRITSIAVRSGRKGHR